MGLIERGKVHEGGIVFASPLALPEGTDVVVHIETPSERPGVPTSHEENLIALPFFGMWADREDLKDSASWVRSERQKWQQRATRQD